MIRKKQSKIVTSYGIILYKIKDKVPHILMINRKDSLCYIDFLRGKYNPYNTEYIQILINKFNVNEKEKVIKYSFKKLWCDLWLLDESEIKLNDNYYKGETKFNIIKNGFTRNKRIYNLNKLIESSYTNYQYPEWEFPKGRKFRNETNKECAIREFSEETGIKRNQYKLFYNMKPFSESYIGENKIKYVHIYYIGILLDDHIPKIDKNNKDQSLEISDIKLLNYKDSLNIIRNYHKTRENIIHNIFDLIQSINNDNYKLI